MTKLLQSLPLLPFALLLIVLPYPGTVAARLLLLLMSGLIAAYIAWREPRARAGLPFLPWLLPWCAVAALSVAYAVDPAYTLRELQNEFGYTAVALLAFFTVTRHLSQRMFLLRAALCGLLLMGGWATLAWIDSGFVWSESSRAGGSGTFASYMVMLWPLLLWLRLDTTHRLERRLTEVALLFCLFLAVISRQRIVLPVFAVQIGLAFWLMACRGHLRIAPRRAAGLLVLLAVLGASGLFVMQHWRYQGKADDASRTSLSADIRWSVWPAVTRNILEHPLSGGGFGRNAMRKAYPELIPAENQQVWHAHNILLNQGISAGVPGVLGALLAFMGLAVFFWRAAADPQRRAAALAGLLIVVGVLLRNQFNDFFVRDLSLFFWAAVGLSARACLSAEKDAV